MTEQTDKIVKAARDWRIAYDAWIKGDTTKTHQEIQFPYERAKHALRAAVVALEKREETATCSPPVS